MKPRKCKSEQPDRMPLGGYCPMWKILGISCVPSVRKRMCYSQLIQKPVFFALDI